MFEAIQGVFTTVVNGSRKKSKNQVNFRIEPRKKIK